jgi:CubicO group peptidase (beta-lactamase class C family)
LRQALAHRAGLPAARPVLPADAIYDWDAMCAALAESAPWWEPDAAHGYHVNTFGFLVGEPARRAFGAPFATALSELVTGPLDLDLQVGVRESDLPRIAEIDAPSAQSLEPDHSGDRESDLDEDSAATAERRRMLLHTYLNPPGLSGVGTVNTRAWRRAAIPSTNGHATARAVAAFYSSFLAGTARPLLSSEMLGEATSSHSEGHDLILDRPSRFGLGFALHLDERPIGATASAFGHYGYGGSLGFADPDAGVAFAYLINRPGDRWQNPRTRGLLEALRGCL